MYVGPMCVCECMYVYMHAFMHACIYVYILMEKSYCALYKLTGQVTGTHPRVEIASGQSLGHVLLFGPTPTHDSLSFYSVEKHILSNFNAVIVMPRLAEQPPDFLHEASLPSVCQCWWWSYQILRLAKATFDPTPL